MALPESIEAVAVTVGPVLGNDGEPRLGFVEVEASDHAAHVPTGTVLAAGPDRYDLDEDGQALVTVAASDADGVDRTRTYTFRVHLVDTKGIPVAEPIERTVTLPAATAEVALELTEAVEAGTELVAVPFVVSVAGLTGPVTAGDLAEALTPELPAPGAVDSVAGLTGDVDAEDLAGQIAGYLPEADPQFDEVQVATLKIPQRGAVTRHRAGLTGWDDFDRATTTSTLGISSCGQLWHDSSTFRINRGAVEKVAAGSVRHTACHYNPRRRNIRIGVWLNTPLSGDFDAGIVLRSPSAGNNRFLFVTACQSTSTVKLFGRTPSADNTLAQETVAFTLGRRYLLEVQDLDDTITVYVDGTLVLTYTLDDVDTFYTSGETPYTESYYYAYWYDVGITAHHSRDNFTRFEGFHWAALGSKRLNMITDIAHRAATAGMAENSLRSMAALPPDVKAVEIDVRRSSDGGWVLMHDETVDRTTNGTGAVSSLTTAELTALVIDNAGGMVPTLAEALDAAYMYGIEEVWVDWGAGSVADLVSILSAHALGVAGRIVCFLSSVAEASQFRTAWPDARIAIGSVTAANVADVVSGATALGGVECLLLAPGDSAFWDNYAAIATILAGGFAAGTSTTNNSDVMAAAYDAGVTVMLNDYAHMINA